MFGNSLQKHFGAIGARVRIVVKGSRFAIDVVGDRHGELFDLRLPQDGSVALRVDDKDPRNRQLLLAVSSASDWSQKFLCGHDEHRWFVAALPQSQLVTTVRDAFEALKPHAVRDEQDRKRVRRRRRQHRKTAAYLRQGEWFFVPRPDAVVDAKYVRHNDVLVRGHGKPHQVEWLYRSPNGDGAIFARGEVSHPDHDAIRLDLWHQVFRNTEAELPKHSVTTPEWDVLFKD